jgi:hypothetical protein
VRDTAALGDALDEARLRNYQKLAREQAFLERKTDARAMVRIG